MHVFAILKDSFWSGAERDACVPSIRDCHISFKKDICLKVTFSPMDVLQIVSLDSIGYPLPSLNSRIFRETDVKIVYLIKLLSAMKWFATLFNMR